MVPAPWAADASQSAGNMVEVALGRYSPGSDSGVESLLMVLMLLELLLRCLVTRMSGLMVAFFWIRSRVHPSSGAGFFAHQSDWGERRWGHVDRVRPDGGVPCLHG